MYFIRNWEREAPGLQAQDKIKIWVAHIVLIYMTKNYSQSMLDSVEWCEASLYYSEMWNLSSMHCSF